MFHMNTLFLLNLSMYRVCVWVFERFALCSLVYMNRNSAAFLKITIFFYIFVLFFLGNFVRPQSTLDFSSTHTFHSPRCSIEHTNNEKIHWKSDKQNRLLCVCVGYFFHLKVQIYYLIDLTVRPLYYSKSSIAHRVFWLKMYLNRLSLKISINYSHFYQCLPVDLLEFMRTHVSLRFETLE